MILAHTVSLACVHPFSDTVLGICRLGRTGEYVLYFQSQACFILIFMLFIWHFINDCHLQKGLHLVIILQLHFFNYNRKINE